ncbi:hypothetical protein [Variovorax sp. GB1P17]|uniref:hypothetical protein n=1 Tax=Variovorax sp. GB1P17 TaxID=3443740 RepID=UPI003F445D2C
METNSLEAAPDGDRKAAKLLADIAAARVVVGLVQQIVILVVVGSSPISHPKISPLRYCSIAIKGLHRRACPGVVISGYRF